MLVLKCLLHVCLLCNVALVTSENVDIQNKTVQKQIFSDVLKNISLANQILQELITNYERLQDIYKSKELLVSDSSNSEIDTAFRFLSSDNREERSRRKKITPSSQETYRPGTAMIYDGSNDDYVSPSTTKKVKHKNRHKKKKVLTITAEDYNDRMTMEGSEEIEIEIPREDVPETTTVDCNSTTVKHVKTLQHKMGKTVKTRFSIKRGTKKSKKSNVDARRVKQIVRTESFSPEKIWQEIISKPVRLNLEETKISPKRKSTIFIQSKPGQKITLVFVSNKVKNKHTDENRDEDQIKIHQRGQSARSILRSTYGDACIVVAVRKCYKAMKKVKKDVCGRGSSCKSSFKSAFTDESKKACLKEFDYSNRESKNDTEDKDFVYRGAKTIEDNKFVDATRDRYIDTCIPSVLSESKIISNITLREHLPELEFHKLNILRDKYERRCKKLSSKKCNSACGYAYSEACSLHKCDKYRKKRFKKSCKRKCDEAYSIFKESSSSSDSSDSESKSDSK